MKKLLTSMAAATLCLGMFALTPVSAGDTTDNVRIDALNLIGPGGQYDRCTNFEGFSSCFRLEHDHDARLAAIERETQILASI